MLFLIARIVLGAYFVLAGVQHLTKSGGLAAYAKSKNVPMPMLSVIVSGVVLALGGLGIIFKQNLTISYDAIAVFLLLAAITIHDFWKTQDAHAKMIDKIQFQKNIALAAALVLLSVC